MARGRSIDEAGFWAARERGMVADVVASAEHAQSAAGRMQQAQRDLDRAYTLRREGLATEGDVAAARDAVQVLEQEAAARVQDEWTRDVTVARRAAWNAAVADRANRTRDGKTVLLVKIERHLGFTLAALKAAVARWGL